MDTIHIRRKLDSEPLHLPEIKPLIGKTVEIIVKEEQIRGTTSPGDWDTAFQAVEELEDYDFDAVRRQRDYDLPLFVGQTFLSALP